MTISAPQPPIILLRIATANSRSSLTKNMAVVVQSMPCFLVTVPQPSHLGMPLFAGRLLDDYQSPP